MSNKLKDEVNDISMNTEMKERILQNIIGQEKKKKIKEYSFLKNSLEFTAACFTVLVCVQLVKSNPEMFKLEDNNNIVEEEIMDYDSNSAYDKKEEIPSSSSESTNNTIYKFNKGENSNKTNFQNTEDSKGAEGKLNINNNQQNNIIPPINKNDNTDNEENRDGNDSNKVIDNSDNVNNIHNNTNIDNDSHKNENEFYDKSDNITDSVLEGTNENECGSSIMGTTDDAVCSGGAVSEFKTIEEAEKVLNFKADLIKDIDKEYEITNIIVLSGKTLSINYSVENKQFTYRESIESGNISGDFNKYDYEINETVGGNNISLKGNSEKIINLATWRSNDKAYSISSENGIEYGDVIDMVKRTIK